MSDRPELYSREAEEQVIGSLLTDPTAIIRVAAILTPESFAIHRHNVIFKAALSISQRNGKTDLVTMVDELRSTNQLEVAGTADYISYVYSQVGSGVHAEYYAGIIKKHEKQRQLLAASARIEELAYEDDVDSAKARAMELLLTRDSSAMKSMTPEERSQAAAKRYYELKTKEHGSLITFGFPSLDATGGMSGGDTVLLGAKTKRGKTTLVHQVARHIALTHGPTGIFSLEMSDDEMFDRDTARLTRVPIPVIQDGMYGDKLYDKILESCLCFRKDNLHYYWPVRCTVPMIYYAAKRQQIEYGLVAVVVDYVQLLRDAGRYENEAVKYSNIAHDLKDMARELKVPVIEVSQYSRGDGEANQKYKGSSAWEQDASWLLHYGTEEDKDGVEHTYITIGGVRQRGLITKDKIELIYDAPSQSFMEVTR
jgi:replicative DNA helicase